LGKTNSPGKLPGYQAPAVPKAFHLLRKVAESNRHLGLAELALRMGYSKSTTHGLLHALLRENELPRHTPRSIVDEEKWVLLLQGSKARIPNPEKISHKYKDFSLLRAKRPSKR